MATKNKFYAYFIPGGQKGVTDEWRICESKVKGVVGARFKGFKDEEEARGWLAKGANYELKANKQLAPGIYFDAGTGRGNGVEISVTDANGVNLLHKALPKKTVNSFGKHLIKDKSATNNYGELLALSYALKIAKKEKVKSIFGDSRLVIDYWSKWRIKRNDLPKKTVELSKDVSESRYEFEKNGGSVKRVSGDNNPADLGFHK
jgi:ribonuclease HI